jgi:DNA-binding beta-propeller fold protein YncE
MTRKLSLFTWIFPCVLLAQAVPHFEADPSWPKPLPKDWSTGLIGGVCTDSHDHIVILNRHMPVDPDYKTVKQAPPMIMFDLAGNVVNSWGDPAKVPVYIHGCIFDKDDNLWIGGRHDGMIQKYSHDGKLLLQIGTKGVFDSSDGTEKGKALNASKTGFYHAAGIAIDKKNGDVYVADGYDNRRVAVFNKKGKFLRQWGRQGTPDEAREGVGGAFAGIVHCVVLGNDGLVYVCDRNGDRVQVFDKSGKFQHNIWLTADKSKVPDPGGVQWVAFSLDPEQKYMYVAAGNKSLVIIDHKSGEILTTFPLPGDLPSGGHTLAIDSKGDLYTDRDSDHSPRAKTDWGHRIQRLTPVEK